MSKLNPKQQSFVNEYLKDKNGTQAAIRAGYSKHTAPEIASRLLRNVKVQKALDSSIAKQAKRIELSADKIIQRIAEFSFNSTVDGSPLKQADKIKAAELLGKHFKLFTDVQIHTVDATVAVVNEADVKAMREKIKGDC
jgi:Terminase small subunit